MHKSSKCPPSVHLNSQQNPFNFRQALQEKQLVSLLSPPFQQTFAQAYTFSSQHSALVRKATSVALTAATQAFSLGQSFCQGAHTCWFSEVAEQDGSIVESRDEAGRNSSPLSSILALEKTIQQRKLESQSSPGKALEPLALSLA